MSDKRFWVVGGEFTDTTFTELIPGTQERYGLFSSYDNAYKEWKAKTGWKVDNCHHRLFIKETNDMSSYKSDLFETPYFNDTIVLKVSQIWLKDGQVEKIVNK